MVVCGDRHCSAGLHVDAVELSVWRHVHQVGLGGAYVVETGSAGFVPAVFCSDGAGGGVLLSGVWCGALSVLSMPALSSLVIEWQAVGVLGCVSGCSRLRAGEPVGSSSILGT